MDFFIKTPAMTGDIVGLYAVAEAIARTYATAVGTTELHRPAYKADLNRHCKWLADEARFGKLSVCGGDKLPTTWADLMKDGEPLDDCIACARAWVRLAVLNAWAATHGDHFQVQTEGVPWIDERGVMGGDLGPIVFKVLPEDFELEYKPPPEEPAMELAECSAEEIREANTPPPRKSWKVVLPYLREFQKTHRLPNCKALFTALESNRDGNAPLRKGEGNQHRGKLYIPMIDKSYELKTFQTYIWPLLKDLK